MRRKDKSNDLFIVSFLKYEKFNYLRDDRGLQLIKKVNYELSDKLSFNF